MCLINLSLFQTVDLFAVSDSQLDLHFSYTGTFLLLEVVLTQDHVKTHTYPRAMM